MHTRTRTCIDTHACTHVTVIFADGKCAAGDGGGDILQEEGPHVNTTSSSSMNAFEKLTAAAKRQSSLTQKAAKKTKTAARHASTTCIKSDSRTKSLVACPICQFTFRQDGIDKHVSSCSLLEKDGKPTAVKQDRVQNTNQQVNASVHDYFGGEDTSVPNYFVLYKQADGFVAKFERKRPRDSSSTDITFQWLKKTVQLRLESNLEFGDVLQVGTSKYTNIPFLKSHLQVGVALSHDVC